MADPRTAWPIRYDEGVPSILTDQPVLAYQLRPDTWHALTTWCRGAELIVDDGQAVVVRLGYQNEGVAVLGDWVVKTDAGFEVVEAADFAQSYSLSEDV